jgi:transcriptional regulator with XRE-family HTH domain
MTIGDAIEGLSKAKNMSIEDFSKAIGVGKSTVYKWKRGETSPDFGAIVSIVTQFPEISLNWLLLGEGPMYRSDSMNGSIEAANNLVNAQNMGKFAKKGYSPMTEQEREEHRQMLERIRQLEQIVEQQSSTIERLVRMLEEKAK